jgi:hypothetical protein
MYTNEVFMKLFVLGARYCTGVSKVGKEFDFGEVNVLTPIEVFHSEKFNVQNAKGFEVTTLNCTREVINMIPDTVNKSAVELDFITDTVLRNGTLQTLIVGINQ